MNRVMRMVVSAVVALCSISLNAQATPPSSATPQASSAISTDNAIRVEGLCTPEASKVTSSECHTDISQQQFEDLWKAISQNQSMSADARANLANSYAGFLVYAREAQHIGLDKTPEFQQLLDFAKLQLLTRALYGKLQKDSAEITPKELDEYYRAHQQEYEEYALIRISIPRQAASKEKPVDEAAEKAYAESLRKRFAAGESADALQSEAYKRIGNSNPAPTTNIGKRRRNTLSSAASSLSNLKPGEISEPILEGTNYYIYRVDSKTTIPEATIEPELKQRLARERFKEKMDAINAQFKTKLNDVYFGTAHGGTTPSTAPKPQKKD